MDWPRLYRPPAELRPIEARPAEPSLNIRWLGTAGHVISTPTTTLLIDPFLSRPSITTTLFRPLHPRPDLWRGWLPEKVDAVVIGHSHYDHLMDAPEIAHSKSALLIGSRTTASFGRARGVPDVQLREIGPAGGVVEVGDMRVRLVPSLHGRLLGAWRPFPGEVLRPPRLPSRFYHYRLGGAYGVHVETSFGSLYHNGSADLVDAELEGLEADLLLVGLAGRKASRDYLRRLVTLLRPSLVVPTHHDFFWSRMEEGPRLLPGVAFDGFLSDARRMAGGARILGPTYTDELHLSLDGAARDAILSRWESSAGGD